MSELPWLRMVLPAESEALAAPTKEDQDAVAAGADLGLLGAKRRTDFGAP
jgi:hypothetical protein